MRALLLLACSLALVAQPGQYPPGQYPPGQYPPGQGPPGRLPGSGIPGIPGRSKKEPAPPPRTFSGVVRKIEAKSLELDASDTRVLTIQILDTTTKPADLRVGDGVDIAATQDKDGKLQAVSIKFNHDVARTITPAPIAKSEPDAPPEPPEPPSTIVAKAGPKNDEGDESPPKLARGVPKQVAEARRIEAARPLEATPAPDIKPDPVPSSRQAIIEKARGVAAEFTKGLPNYICTQVTTRYSSDTRPPSWNVMDVISTDLVYENGKESYRNFKINGKASKKSPEESGSWSYGEFGTILAGLFTPGMADFKYAQQATIARHPALVFDYKVERSHSNWKIEAPGQYIRPAYKGSVWIDKESAHVLRIEMLARDIPEEFPRVTAETAVDYDYISLGTPEKFLLPVRAEVLSCVRGSSECERNVIEFRNYHKFTGQSTIEFK